MTPKVRVRAVMLLASACADVTTLAAVLMSAVAIVASTWTLAAVTASEMASGDTPTAVAR